MAKKKTATKKRRRKPASERAELTLKELHEQRGELSDAIDAHDERLRKYAVQMTGLLADRDAEDFDDNFSALNEKLQGCEKKLGDLNAERNELDTTIAAAKRASQYAQPPVDGSRHGSSDGSGEQKPTDGLSFFGAKGGDGANDPVSAYSWNHLGKRRDNVFNGDTKVITPAHVGANSGDISAKVLASREYEQAFAAYMRKIGTTKGAESFEMFVRNSSQYNGLGDFVEGIGIPQLPMRLVNLYECECDDAFFFRMLATVHQVNDACCLEIWKRGPKVTSFSWGNVCKEPPKSGMPGANAKVLTPWQWTQAAQICRRQLMCNAIDPLDMLFRDMADERNCELEFAYFYGSGFQQPLGLYTDTGIPTYTFAPDEIDADGCLVDPAVSLAKMWCAFPQKCRRRNDLVWIMKDSQYCKILLSATRGGGCCKHGLHISEGPGGDMPRVNMLSAPGMPAIPVYVIDDEVCKKLEERYPDHPAMDVLVSLGSLSSYHIADFALGTTLETDDNILDDSRCWVQRSFTDGLMTCPNMMLNGRAPGEVEMAAFKKTKGGIWTPNETKMQQAIQELAAIATKYAPQS